VRRDRTTHEPTLDHVYNFGTFVLLAQGHCSGSVWAARDIINRRGAMNRRIALVTTLASAALSGCYYPQYFDVTWDEPVRLQDGTVISVNFKFTHERLNRLSRYEYAILRNTTMSFDAGPPFGRVSQVFNRMQPVLLNRYNGSWYAVIVPRGSGDDPSISGQDWGPWQSAHAEWPLKLTGSGFKTIPMAEFPDEIVAQNLIRNVPAEEMAEFDKKQIDLNDKKLLVAKHVLHPEHRTLKKPRPPSTAQQSN
jgi:hypothetical protein